MNKIYQNSCIFALMLLGLVSCLDIEEIGFINLKASFLPSSTLVQLGTPILFNQQSTTVAKNFQWDFGDGNTSTERSPEHLYDSVGTYTVKLVTTKADGTTQDSTSQQILVIPDTDSISVFSTFGDALSEEIGFSFTRVQGGDYLLAGRKNLNTLLLIRTDASRQVVWQKEFNNIANGRGQIIVKDITPTVDGGAILAGYYQYNINDTDAFVLKVNNQGDEQWLQTLKTQQVEQFNRVLEYNGLFIVVGTISDVTSGGNLTPSLVVWFLEQNGDQNDLVIGGSNWTANDFTFTFDGGFAFAVTEGDRPRIFKYNNDALEELEIFVPTINNRPFEGRALGITQLLNGDLVLVGEVTYDDASGNPSDSTNAFIASFDEFGTHQWTDLRAYYSESYNDVRQSTDGSIIAVGTHENPLSGRDVLVGRYSPDGTDFRVKLIGASQDDEGFTVRPELNGEFSVIGTTRSFGNGLRDFYFIRLNDQLQ